MKSIFLICLIISVACGTSCTNSCNSYEERKIKGLIDEYFGVYKPGNWWTYRNQNATNKDSIYITDFSEVTNRNRTICANLQVRKFALKNQMLNGGLDLFATYSADKGSVGIYFSNTNNQTIGAAFPFFRFDDNVGVLWSFPEGTANNFLDSIVLNNITYYNIPKGSFAGNNYYFSKNKGLVGWTTGSNVYNLVASSIQ